MDFDRRTSWHDLAISKIEQRAVAQGSDEKHPIITGYGAVFYNAKDPGTQYQLWPGVVERIDPHAFDVAIRENDIVGLYNHNPDHVLGRNRSGTLKLSIDETGLYYEIDPPATQLAKQVSVSIERRDITGSSFAFDIEAEEISDEGDIVVRTIKKARLYDVGPVTYPAYTASTTQVSQRSRLSLDGLLTRRDLLDLRKRKLELLRRAIDSAYIPRA